jgi:hypothetical protein
MPSSRDLLHAFTERVWNRADLSGIEDLVGGQYQVVDRLGVAQQLGLFG